MLAPVDVCLLVIGIGSRGEPCREAVAIPVRVMAPLVSLNVVSVPEVVVEVYVVEVVEVGGNELRGRGGPIVIAS